MGSTGRSSNSNWRFDWGCRISDVAIAIRDLGGRRYEVSVTADESSSPSGEPSDPTIATDASVSTTDVHRRAHDGSDCERLGVADRGLAQRRADPAIDFLGLGVAAGRGGVIGCRALSVSVFYHV
jgi:hypothetical protein